MPFDNEIVVWRVRADGSIDPAFGCCGYAMLSSGDDVELPSDITLDDRNRILVSALSGFDIVRFTAGGMPDTDFGTDGRVAIDFSDLGFEAAFAWAVGVDGADRIVAAGGVEAGESHDLVVVRLDDSGRPDATFGNAGRVVIPQGMPGASRSAALHAIAVQRDGSLYAAGNTTANPGGTWRGFVVVHLNADGTLDAGFGADGIAAFAPQYAVGGDWARAVFVDRDGVLLAGGCGYGADTESGWFCALRLDLDGRIDARYGAGGWAQITPAPVVRARVSALRQGDGKLVLAGTTPIGGPTDFAVARLTQAGEPDASFGAGSGYVAVSFGGNTSDSYDHAAGIALQGGRIVATGDTDGVPYVRALAALRLANDLVFAGSFD